MTSLIGLFSEFAISINCAILLNMTLPPRLIFRHLYDSVDAFYIPYFIYDFGADLLIQFDGHEGDVALLLTGDVHLADVDFIVAEDCRHPCDRPEGVLMEYEQGVVVA